MATLLPASGSSGAYSKTYIADIGDAANIVTTLKNFYYGTTDGSTSTSAGIFGALETLYYGNPTLAGNVTVTGNLTVNGTTTTINSTTVTVDDIVVELGAVASPSNTTANGGGMILLAGGGGNDKSIIWDSTNSNWTTSENWNLSAGKTLKINNVAIASGTGAALVLGGNASTSITLGHASGTTTILGTTQLTSGSTKIGNTTLTQGGTVGITLPTLAGTLVGTGDTGSVTSTMIADGTIATGDLASSSSTTTGVTYAKMQYASAQYRVLGRISASAGIIEELTPNNLITTLNQATSALSLSAGGTGATSAPSSMANLMGYTSTVTAAGTTTLTNTSSYYQQFTGSTTQTVVLPVTSTLTQGWTFHIVNNSTGNITVNSSGAQAVIVVIPGTTAMVTCISVAGSGLSSEWETGLTDFSTYTGSGAVVMGTSPAITTSLTTPSTSFDLVNTTATTLNIGGAATTLSLGNTATAAQTVNIGAASTGASTYNIGTGATASSTIKNINIGTSGVSSSVTNITLGSSTAGAVGTTAINGSIRLSTPPAVITGTTYTVGINDTFLIFNTSATGCTVTMPTASSYAGRVIWMKQIAALAVSSAASNVQPLNSVTAGTAILSGAGKFAQLVSNGTDWVIMNAN